MNLNYKGFPIKTWHGYQWNAYLVVKETGLFLVKEALASGRGSSEYEAIANLINMLRAQGL